MASKVPLIRVSEPSSVSRVDAPVRLFHNNGDKTFTDVTDAMEIKTYRPRRRDGKNIVWFDFDNDGDLDITIASDQLPLIFGAVPNQYLFLN